VRIVREKALEDAARRYPKSAAYLATWVKIVRNASWRNIADVRASYPSADMVRVRSGKPVYVFNVCGNAYRLVVALHFNTQMAFTLRFLTHAEYSKDRWKDDL